MRAGLRDPRPLPAPCPQAETQWTVEITAVTPIYRGGPARDAIDERRPFRASAVRGLLRTWWRATSALENPRELWKREAELFGTVFGPDGARASRVRVGTKGPPSVPVAKPREVEYVLWVERTHDKLFHDQARATLTVSCPADRAEEVRHALSAWLLLGGIGSRTRRGLGAVDVSHPALRPELPTVDALVAWLRQLAPAPAVRAWPSLGGGSVLLGVPQKDPMSAWRVAVQTLQALRMDTGRGQTRPVPLEFSPHRWHDDDYVAFTAGEPFASPRAALGLPLQFQRWGTRDRWKMEPAGPRQVDRLPSPIHLRPVRIGPSWVPMMATLRVPYPAEVEVRGAGRARGRIDPRGVDLFLDDLERAGWSRHRLEAT